MSDQRFGCETWIRKRQGGSIFAAVFLAISFSVGCQRPSNDSTQKPGVEQAVSDAVDAYIYGYPLVTMDMTRKVYSNTATATDSRAPMGQFIRMRTYPAVDDHTVTAPNADTLY